MDIINSEVKGKIRFQKTSIIQSPELVLYYNNNNNATVSHRLAYFGKCDTKNWEKILYLEKISEMKMRCKRFGENFIHVKKFLGGKYE